MHRRKICAGFSSLKTHVPSYALPHLILKAYLLCTAFGQRPGEVLVQNGANSAVNHIPQSIQTAHRVLLSLYFKCSDSSPSTKRTSFPVHEYVNLISGRSAGRSNRAHPWDENIQHRSKPTAGKHVCSRTPLEAARGGNYQ